MPYVKIEVTREGVTREQKLALVKGVTQLLQEVLNKNPQTTHIVIDEVDTDNWGVGAHTDWAVGFPFAAMGLPDNYSIPLPSLTQFGFTYDVSYVQLSEARLWKGLLLGHEEQRQAANVAGMRLTEYRAELRRRYHGIYQSIKNQSTREDHQE